MGYTVGRPSGIPKGSRGGKRGPPPFAPTPDQVETAKYLIGRRQYPGRVANILVRKYREVGLSVADAYRVIEAARDEAVHALAGQGHDPMGAMFLFLESIIGDGTQPMAHRLAACANVIRMLGLDRLIKRLDAGGVEAYLARLAGAQAARVTTPERVEDAEPERPGGQE